MAIALSGSLVAAMGLAVRRPVVRVWAYPAGVAHDVTADLVRWSCERSRGQQAGAAELTLANPAGAYDAARSAWVAPGTRIVMRAGLHTAAGDELVTVFTGEVADTESSYGRGQGEMIRVRALDRAGRALRTEITSPRYLDSQASAIITALFTAYGGLAPAEIALSPVDYVVPRVQFVEESLMDAGYLLAQAAGRRLFFDAEGVLRWEPLGVPGVVAWSHADGKAIVAAREERRPPRATRVTVTGRLHDPVRQAGDEVAWAEATARDYEYGLMLEVPFAPSGAVYEEVRLEPVTPLAPFEQVTLYASSGTGITVKIVSPGGRDITFRCHGKQVYYTTPYAVGTASDPALATRVGDIAREVTNPAVRDDLGAALLAARLLEEAIRAQRRLTLRLLANPGLEPGDLLAITHPRTGEALYVLADAVRHAGRRGVEDSTTVEGCVV
jgi:hypothetical protein